MQKRWLLRLLILGLLLLPLVGVEVASAQNDVTFQVNMSIMMREFKFLPGSGDIVTVPGSFNSWSTTADTLQAGTAPNDSIYSKTISLPTGNISYKFFKTLRGGLDWEGDPNRTDSVVAGAQTLPLVWFNRDSVYVPPVNQPVTFSVNMRVKILEQSFIPDSGDIVRVAGSFDNWGSSTDTLVKGAPPNDSIYSKAIQLTEGTAVQYKFLKTLRGGLDWENGDNRNFTVPVGGGSPPLVYFDNDSVVNTPISANVLGQVDMTARENLGWFDPAKDTMEVRGSFQGWGGGTTMDFNILSTATWERVWPYVGTSGDQLYYKYHMTLDSTEAAAVFSGFAPSSNGDGIQYDHPYERGDGNRIFLAEASGNIGPPIAYFSNIDPRGLLLHATDTVRVNFSVNMGPATRNPDAFLPATDTVRLTFQDQAWWRSQITNQGAANFSQNVNLTHDSPSDTIYHGSFLVKGMTHYGIMYTYTYLHSGTGSVSEGGGLGAQNIFRSRFIQPIAPNSFPTSYTMPLDTWENSAPHTCEIPPYNLTSVGPTNNDVPLTFQLSQNYPNPFNPTTRISYSIPKAARVTLTVYNLLGQVVATLVNTDQQPGKYVALFEANRFASGVYFYRLQAGNFSDVRKMLLLK